MSQKMKNDEGWMKNDKGWWFQAVEGFWLQTVITDICECRVAFATEKSLLRENVPTGWEGVKKGCQTPQLKIPLY